MPIDHDIPRSVEVEIEVPRGGRTKRDAAGRVEGWSPVGLPFNYGHVVGVLGGDGDPQDAVVLGARLEPGSHAVWSVVAVVRFTDQGLRDDKWVCARGPLKARDRGLLVAFFSLYAAVKRVGSGWRSHTRFHGVDG